MNDLVRSLQEQIPVDIIYVSTRNNISKRRIIVKSIKNQHIHAYCYLRRLYRTFKKEHILSTQLVYRSTNS